MTNSSGGAIVGGVVGGIVAFSIVIVAILHRQRRRLQDASAGVGASQPKQNNEAVVQSPSGTQPKMKTYDPDDPTTFAGYQERPLSQDISSVSQLPLSPHVASGSTLPMADMQTSQAHARGYHGLPQPA